MSRDLLDKANTEGGKGISENANVASTIALTALTPVNDAQFVSVACAGVKYAAQRTRLQGPRQSGRRNEVNAI